MATTYDEARADAFASKLLEVLNGGALTVMISVGHRTGLFDALAGLPSPATSAEVAEAAELDERYVREWLAAMTVGGIVEHDPTEATYRLPAEHAAWLTRAASPNNFAVSAQFVPLVATVEDDIVRCFREGGGVAYDRYARFHEVMAEESDQTVGTALLDHILPLVPGLVDQLDAGIRVLDVGCGRGRALLRLAERFPQSEFVGYDLSLDAVAFATDRARDAGLANVTFEARDVSSFDRDAERDAYDLITTFDAVHDQAHPLAVLRGIHRALKPTGTYLMQDIYASSHLHENTDHPLGTMLYTISCMHCMTVSLAQDGEGLGTMWGEQKARELLAEAGFRSIALERLEHDIQNAYYISTP